MRMNDIIGLMLIASEITVIVMLTVEWVQRRALVRQRIERRLAESVKQ